MKCSANKSVEKKLTITYVEHRPHEVARAAHEVARAAHEVARAAGCVGDATDTQRKGLYTRIINIRVFAENLGGLGFL